MFQEFDNSSDSTKSKERLTALREEMKRENVTHFLIPHADEHQNEYLPERAARLAWLTGFTGSAGFAIVTLETAVVFVDGRYTLQVHDQIDGACFSVESLVKTPPSKWLEANLTSGNRVGYDAWLLTLRQCERFGKTAAEAEAELVSVDNLVDRIWSDQPQPPLGNVKVQELQYAGKTALDKRVQIQEIITSKGAGLCILSDPASLAWIFNIRGSDVVHNPLVLSYALLPASGKPHIFMDERKLDTTTRAYLEELAKLCEPAHLKDKLAALSKNAKILCDADLVSGALGNVITQADGKIIKGRDPVVLPRAIKNECEIEGMRKAHLRDGVAVVKYLSWLDAQPIDDLDEISAARKLEEIRAENAVLAGSRLEEISFDTISGFGPNGAIVHYRVSEATNRKFDSNSLYLNDSGGQYLDGTTDITRTIAIGEPPNRAIEDFTLVLKGHIALAMARFPVGTRGVDLDVLARNALWQKGKDFAHGTGHGVGAYLNVHEGPQSISRRGMEPLLPGMIISNEPGYYVEGEYGIRIENLVLVCEAESNEGGNIETHRFETLTLAPIDLRLVDVTLLNADERDWLNSYHARVFEEVSPHLDLEQEKYTLDWLKQATRAI